MTRKKKTRSLKRIHSTKTGNAAKLKRQSGFDRQGTKKVKKRTPSAYEKFLAENPDANNDMVAAGAQKKPNDPSDTPYGSKQTPQQPSQSTQNPDDSSASKAGKPKSLLDQLDSKDFDGFY